MDARSRKILTRCYAFTITMSVLLLVLGIIDDGFSIESTAANVSMLVAFVTLFPIVNRMPKKNEKPNTRERSVNIDRVLCLVSVGASIATIYFVFVYSDSSNISILVVLLLLTPVLIYLLAFWLRHRQNKNVTPPA